MSKDPVLDHTQNLIDQINVDNEDAPDMVMQALVMLVCYDAEKGTKFIRIFKNEDLRTWEALGMLKHLENELASQNLVQWMED